MNTGAELIAIERNEKQILKHGFTAEHHAKHPEWYNERQLVQAATLLTLEDLRQNTWFPKNWDAEWFKNLCLRNYKDRLIIAATLLAAEWDRLDYIQKEK